jgi:hypothetical protein
MALQVITKTTSDPIITFAQPMPFQFSLGENEAIVAYSVALNYFNLQYATDSGYNSEEVAQVAVRLIHNFIGDTVLVTPQMLLTDGGGSAASETQDVSGRESTLTISVMAWVGNSLPSSQSLQLLNCFGVPASSTSVITINEEATNNLAFLSGFGASFGNQQEQINSFSATTSFSTNYGTQLTPSGTTALAGSDVASYSLTDVGVVSFTNDYGLQLFDATASYDSVDGTNGMGGTISADITIPSGYSQIVCAVPLITYFDLEFSGSDTYHIAQFEAGITGGPGFPSGSTFPMTSSGTLTWDLHFNMWDDRGINTSMGSAAITAQILVQFA